MTMNIYSVHSHKGGVGKTTFSLFLSKYLATVKKEKTCLIDLDFQAQGLRGAYLMDRVEYDFVDYLTAREKEKNEIAEKIAVKYRDFDNLYFIVSHFKPEIRMGDQLERINKMYLKVLNEPYTGEIADNMEQLLGYLEKAGYKNVVIDDHPGLVLLSEAIIKHITARPVFITTPDITSFIGLFKNLLARADGWGLSLMDARILLNRAPANLSTEQIETAIDAFLDSPDYSSDERLPSAKLKKVLRAGEVGIMMLAENQSLHHIDTVFNPRTLLSLDIPEDLLQLAERITT